MKPEHVSTEFRCPKCGGNQFSSSGNGLGDRTYYCSGTRTYRCRFTWPECDTWEHFVRVAVARFDSDAEYQAEYQATTAAQFRATDRKE